MSTVIEFNTPGLVPVLFGEHNSHLKHLEEKLGISISDRGNQLTLNGDNRAVKQAEQILNSLWERAKKSQDITLAEFDAALRFLNTDDLHDGIPAPKAKKGELILKTKKKSISPRSPNQAEYIEKILNNDMTFGIGPAGTGKTYLAVAAGVSMYLRVEVEKLIFTRPAVEAGENLGFLPGDMKDKVDPYLRPIYDALHDTLHWDIMMKKMESGDIEIAPLAFMRGRTLSNAFVVLDEAQNTTCAQMKMFLTRMGEASRMVITGDLTQTDLPKGMKSGLRDASETLKGVKGIKFSHFTSKDVIRHALVGRIIEAYDSRN